MVQLSDLQVYLAEINRIPLLSAEEEIDLAHRIRAGDFEAREEMIQSNLRLVVSIARAYLQRGLPLMDLIEEGNLGLIKAVEKFDPDEGCRFSTYASWWIRQSIGRSICNSVKTVRVPAYVMDLISRWKNVRAALEARLGRAPTQTELVESMDLKPCERKGFRRAMDTSAHLDQFISLDAGFHSRDLIPDEDDAGPETRVLHDIDLESLRILMDEMTEVEQTVLKLRYGIGSEEPMTLKAIGDVVGVNREKVRQIEESCLRRLAKVLIDE